MSGGRKQVRRREPRHRFDDPNHRLVRNGPAHRYFCALDEDQRLEMVRTLGTAFVQRFGHGQGIAWMRTATVEVDSKEIDDFLKSPSAKLGSTAIGDFFGPKLSAVWEDALTFLGEKADHPNIEDLREMSDSLVACHSVEWVGMLLAATVEVKVVASKTLVEFSKTDHVVCPFFLPATSGMDPVPMNDRFVDPIVRENRRQRRQEERFRKRQIREQQASSIQQLREFATKNKASEASEDDDTSTVTAGVNSSQVGLDRMIHPHLPPQAVNQSDYPVGMLGTAFIYWGPLEDQGKSRPVLVVASNSSHLWIRPIFTNDYKAGRWRAVEIWDWSKANLNHQSYVSSDVLRINRSRCSLRPTQLTDRDWNRVCRGEVH